MAVITTDNARYVEFLAKFTAGVFSADQIDYISGLIAKELQEQTAKPKIKSMLTKVTFVSSTV